MNMATLNALYCLAERLEASGGEQIDDYMAVLSKRYAALRHDIVFYHPVRGWYATSNWRVVFNARFPDFEPMEVDA